jgi:hypothetical protein
VLDIAFDTRVIDEHARRAQVGDFHPMSVAGDFAAADRRPPTENLTRPAT